MKARTFLKQLRSELKHLEPNTMDPKNLTSIENEITQYLNETKTEITTLNLKQIKLLLKSKHMPIWKLIRAMGISRNHFYELSHKNFSGKENLLVQGLKKLGIDMKIVKHAN